MAFGPAVTGDIRVVSTRDDAIDWSATPRLDYIDTHDWSLLRLRDGRTPYVFTLRELSKPQLAAISARPSPERELFAFLAGCSDFSAAAEFGLKWEGDGAERRIKIGSIDRLPADIIREIGAVVIKRGSLTEGESRGAAR